jgi:hypothetical protein
MRAYSEHKIIWVYTAIRCGYSVSSCNIRVYNGHKIISVYTDHRDTHGKVGDVQNGEEQIHGGRSLQLFLNEIEMM